MTALETPTTESPIIDFETMDFETTVARHEAGHVIVYHKFGKVFQSVCIIREETGAGRCIPFQADRPRDWDAVLLTEWLIVACAGVAAEMLYELPDAPMKNWLMQEDVFVLLRLYQQQHGLEATLPWAGRCWLEAERIVQSKRKSVEKVAQALLMKKIITGAEAAALIERNEVIELAEAEVV